MRNENIRKIISKLSIFCLLLTITTIGFKNFLITLKGFKLAKKSKFFNDKYYIKNNKDINFFKFNPFVHYICYGAKEGRNPSSIFNTKFYLSRYDDVKNSKINPLIHYCLFGIHEKRLINNKQKTKKENKQQKKEKKKEQEETKKKNKIIQKNYVNLTHPIFENMPLVSIIILNRNGIDNLKRLFKNFKENIVYSNYEIIVVDNNSNDESIEFLEEISKNLPLRIIKNNVNTNFSEGNNQGVRASKGEYILLLNNDIETTYGWLNEMMGEIINKNNIGSVGAKLVFPIDYGESLKVQHVGITFEAEGDDFIANNLGIGMNPFDKNIKTDIVAGVTAAVLLIKKSVYDEVGGLDERYVYGFEDVDLGLKLFKKGYDSILCSTALLFHYQSSTRIKDSREERSKKHEHNFHLLNKIWKPFLFEKILEEKLNCQPLLTTELLKIGIIVSKIEPKLRFDDTSTALELSKELINFGYNIEFITGDDEFNNPNFDIIINLLHNYDISKLNLKENTIKIAWMRNCFEKWVTKPEIHDYDVYMASSNKACEYVNKILDKKVFLLANATNPNRFNNIPPFNEYLSDYCFTGNYWNVPREIIEFLEPDELDYNFAIYGENWDKIDKFKKYNKGFLEYYDLPKIYASTKLVIDDANHVAKEFGAVNSRVFDAIATKKLVLTNGEIGSEELFNGLVPFFKTKEELNNLINFYLKNDDIRNTKIKKLYELLIKNHTYKKRAEELKQIFEWAIKKKLKFLNSSI
ncbi:MAG: glycosyltransferase [Methanobrevibacter sp.]|jgi:GT2 family glycosyltransferase|nr:glycosyltransferase [Methanobrevibacter sp.]